MNARWCVGTLFLLFLYFGALQEQVSVPNQEIVLEFVNAKVKQQDVQNTIVDVREKLLEIGVSNITIQETESNTLKISYYSEIHIENIKDALLEENQLALDNPSENKEHQNTDIDYSIDVYEITDDIDLSKHQDSLVFDSKYIADRSTINQNYSLVKNVQNLKDNLLFKIAYKAYKRNPFTKDFTSHKEPDVRAGPFFS